MLSPILAFAIALMFMKRTGLVFVTYTLTIPDSFAQLVHDIKAAVYAEASRRRSSCAPAILKSGPKPVALRPTLLSSSRLKYSPCRYLCNQCFFAASYLMDISLSQDLELYFDINNYLAAANRSEESRDPRARRSLGLSPHILPNGMNYFDRLCCR